MPKKIYDFFCFGALHIDIKAKSLKKPLLGESVPVSLERCFGGVAHNVAVDLAKMNARVGLCSIVGVDREGYELKKGLRKIGVDIKDVMHSKTCPTARYTALLEQNGELFIALAEMAIYDELKRDLVRPVLAKRAAVKNLVIDANLPESSIKFIAENKSAHQRLWGVATSCFKTLRLEQGFPHWCGLFLNKSELLTLSQKNDLKSGMNHLARRGLSYLLVTAGKEGIYCWHEGEIMHKPSLPSKVVDATGAGDAFCAGVLLALNENESIDSAIEQGLMGAQAALSSFKSTGIIDG